MVHLREWQTFLYDAKHVDEMRENDSHLTERQR